MKRIILSTILFILLLVASIAVIVLLPIQPEPREDAELGLTFSTRAASALGLDWQQVYADTINDLNPAYIRIPVYWNELESDEDVYNWDAIDYQLNLINETDTKVILALGHKLPRWPECHIPEWVQDKSEDQIEQELFEYVGDAVNRYKDNSNVYAYQIQNEVLFTFGECPEWSKNRNRLKRLINLVHELDPSHKVLTSDSGELSTWLRTSTLPVDSLAISLYRVAYNSENGYFHWPVNPYYYKIHKLLVRPFVEDIIISELQMEPWGPESVENLDQEEVDKSFSVSDFSERVDFAKRTGASVILGWGVEWWYYMKVDRGNDAYWNEAIKFYNQ